MHYLGVAEFAEVQIETVSLKATKRAESLRVSMWQGNRRILEAMVWVVDALQGLEHSDYVAPAVPAPESLRTWQELRPDEAPHFPFWRNFERKPVEWTEVWPPAGPLAPRWSEWFRLTPTPTFEDPFLDAGRSLLMIDTMQWPAASLAHAHRRAGYVAPTIDLSVNFHEFAPTEPWLLCEARAPVAHAGLIGGAATIWTRGGRLLASGAGHLLCRPVPPEAPGAA